MTVRSSRGNGERVAGSATWRQAERAVEVTGLVDEVAQTCGGASIGRAVALHGGTLSGAPVHLASAYGSSQTSRQRPTALGWPLPSVPSGNVQPATFFTRSLVPMTVAVPTPKETGTCSLRRRPISSTMA